MEDDKKEFNLFCDVMLEMRIYRYKIINIEIKLNFCQGYNIWKNNLK